jgi:hypothetical protein
MHREHEAEEEPNHWGAEEVVYNDCSEKMARGSWMMEMAGNDIHSSEALLVRRMMVALDVRFGGLHWRTAYGVSALAGAASVAAGHAVSAGYAASAEHGASAVSEVSAACEMSAAASEASAACEMSAACAVACAACAVVSVVVSAVSAVGAVSAVSAVGAVNAANAVSAVGAVSAVSAVSAVVGAGSAAYAAVVVVVVVEAEAEAGYQDVIWEESTAENRPNQIDEAYMMGVARVAFPAVQPETSKISVEISELVVAVVEEEEDQTQDQTQTLLPSEWKAATV